MKLIFNNKTIELKENEECFNDCIFLKELLDCDQNQNVTLDKESLFFENFILNNTLHLENFSKYNNKNFEDLFLEFGYYGYEKGIKQLRKIVKPYILRELANSKEVEQFFLDYPKFIKWPDIIQNPNISETFIEKLIEQKEKVHWGYVASLGKYSEYFFRKYIERFPDGSICCNEDIPEECFSRLIKEIELNSDDWKRISFRINITEKFVEENIENITFKKLLYKHNISAEFLIKHFDRIVWDCSKYLMLYTGNRELYIKYIKDQKLQQKCFDDKATIEEMEEIMNSDDGVLIHAITKTTVPLEFFTKHILKFKNISWFYICQKRKDLNMKFLETHINIVDFPALSQNKNIPLDFLYKYIENKPFCWKSLCLNTGIPESFFMKYIDKIIWIKLCRNTNISEKFFTKYRKFVDIRELSSNKNISETFINRYPTKYWECLAINPGLSIKYFRKHTDKPIENTIYNRFKYDENADISSHCLFRYLNT